MILKKIKSFFSKKGINEFLVKGIADFTHLLDEIDDICSWGNKVYIANIGRDYKVNIQLLHPRILYESDLLPKELRKKKWLSFSFGLYIADLETRQHKVNFEKLEIFNEFIPIKKVDGEFTYFLFTSDDKEKTSEIITLILKYVFSYDDSDNAVVNFHYWKASRSIYLGRDII